MTEKTMSEILSQGVEREVRTLIGDLHMQVIVLRQMMEVAQREQMMAPQAPPQPKEPVTPQEKHPNPVPQPLKDPIPQPAPPPQQDPRGVEAVKGTRQRVSLNGGVDGNRHG